MDFDSVDRFFRKWLTSLAIGNKASLLEYKEFKPDIYRFYRDLTPLVKPARKKISCSSSRSKRFYRYVLFAQIYFTFTKNLL